MIRNPKRLFGDTYSGSVCISRWEWKSAPFESLLEMHWLIQKDLFTFDLTMLDAQPFSFEYRFEGKRRQWIPDFRYRTRSQTAMTLVEIKPIARLYPRDPDQRAQERARWEAIALAVEAQGMAFELFTENEIRVRPRLDNAMALLDGARRHFPRDVETAALSAALRIPSGSTPRDLARAMGRQAPGFRAAMRLAWLGVITMDPSEVWNADTPFVRSSRPLL